MVEKASSRFPSMTGLAATTIGGSVVVLGAGDIGSAPVDFPVSCAGEADTGLAVLPASCACTSVYPAGFFSKV